MGADALQLTRIVLREIRLPLREPFRISSGVVHERRILLLELFDASEATTWAECVAGEEPNYSEETIDTAWHAITEWIAPRVLGRMLPHPRAVDPLLHRDIRGHRMAKAAVEMGTWALAAQRDDTSLAQYIGAVRDSVPVGVSLGIQQTPDALVERARAAFDVGYRKIKLKIAPGSDIAFVRAVRSALGDDAPLMADANNAYSLADADHLAGLDELGLMMLEQPLEHDDIVRHAELQRCLRTPLCLDESITSVARAEDMITLRAGRIINIKPGRVGGFSQSIAIHDLCQTHGIPVWCGGMLESGIGRAYNVALAALPGFTLPGDISPSARYWERDVVTPPFTMSEGLVRVPEGAGLGVEVDRRYIEELTVRTLEVTA